MIVIVTGGRNYSGRDALRSALDELHAREPVSRPYKLRWPERIGWFPRRARQELGLDSGEIAGGGAVRHGGADRWADEWARATLGDKNTHAMPADWATYPKAGGPIRNADMVALAVNLDPSAERVCVVCTGGAGTADCRRKAKAAGFRVIEVAMTARYHQLPWVGFRCAVTPLLHASAPDAQSVAGEVPSSPATPAPSPERVVESAIGTGAPFDRRNNG